MKYDKERLFEVMKKVNPDFSLNNEWTNNIIEYLTSYYGNARNYNALHKLIKEIVDIALRAKSFNSFSEFIGYHNPKYWEINKYENYKNIWWSKLAYLLNVTDNIIRDDVDELFVEKVINIMDLVIDDRQNNEF